MRIVLFMLVVILQTSAQAQRGPAPPKSPKDTAPIDITGNWVSIVTEDWRWRMLTPKKGDYTSVPLNPEGKKVADTWDPSKAATDSCKAYGAAGLMRVPGRLHIQWANDTTLQIDADAGLQTRMLRFDKSQEPRGARSWQGDSTAEWEPIPSPGGAGVSIQQGPGKVGTLKVATTNLRAGYLRFNGVPYSDSTHVTEYFDRLSAYGAEWLTVFTVVEDPVYLNQPFITSTHFKREPDQSKWMPRPCEPAAKK